MRSSVGHGRWTVVGLIGGVLPLEVVQQSQNPGPWRVSSKCWGSRCAELGANYVKLGISCKFL